MGSPQENVKEEAQKYMVKDLPPNADGNVVETHNESLSIGGGM